MHMGVAGFRPTNTEMILWDGPGFVVGYLILIALCLVECNLGTCHVCMGWLGCDWDILGSLIFR